MNQTTFPRAIPTFLALVVALAAALVLVMPVSADTTFTLDTSGAEEVCEPATDCGGDGTGTAVIEVITSTDPAEICFTFTGEGVTFPIAAGHIHEAPVGVAGDVVVPLFTDTDPQAAFPIEGCVEVEAELAAEIEANPADYYVNLHNADFPAGALRGQLGVEAAAASAASYINPDTGAATENPDVDPASECETPDQSDTQEVSPAGETINNVHNDACLFDESGIDVDAQVSFESSGVGVISACPDPDGDGPKTATNDGTTCTMSGFQETGMPGDLEYHARLNSEEAGTQTVVFCADPEGNGCDDATISDTITIDWVAASELPDAALDATGQNGGNGIAILFGIMALASISFLGYRTVAARRTR
ncbi:hypothetical protein BH24CHL10_BH24CHL10_08030 [soil metagenome]